MNESVIPTFGDKLFSVQKNMCSVKKSASNPHFKSKYADLNEVLDVAKEQLNTYGLVLTQPIGRDTMGDFVETRIFDPASGSAINSVFYLTDNSRDNVQKKGAEITYGRRYTLSSLLALESEDDDGESAMDRKPTAQAYVPKTLNKPVQAATQPTEHAKLMNLLNETSKVLNASSVLTLPEIVKYMATEYGVTKKEDLTVSQAKSFISYMNSLMNKEQNNG